MTRSSERPRLQKSVPNAQFLVVISITRNVGWRRQAVFSSRCSQKPQTRQRTPLSNLDPGTFGAILCQTLSGNLTDSKAFVQLLSNMSCFQDIENLSDAHVMYAFA